MYDGFNLLEETKKAEAGNTDSMRNVAFYLLYENDGDKIEPEITERCMRYLEAAVEAGNPDAMLDLGGMYIDGLGIPKDREKGLEYYLMALETGFPYAFGRTANFYLYDEDNEGLGYLPQTDDEERREKAFDYFLAGAEAGHGGCLNDVGVMWMCGEIGERDPEKAFEYFMKAFTAEYADYSDRAEAAYNIAQCYHYGEGTEANLELAKEYAQKSVDFEALNEKNGLSRSDYFKNRYSEELYKIIADMEE